MKKILVILFMKILFCLPGREFSGNFLQSWTNLVSYCNYKGYQLIYNQKYSCNIYYARNMCLGGNILAGENQKPFGGKVDYNLGWLLGFRREEYIFEGNQTIVGESILDLIGTTYVYILLDDFNNNKPSLLLVEKNLSIDPSFAGDFILKDRLVSKNSESKLIFTGLHITKRSYLKSDSKVFSMNKVWSDLIKDKNLIFINKVNDRFCYKSNLFFIQFSMHWK